MEQTHARTCVYKIGYHIVFCRKYRAKVLTGAVEVSAQKVFHETAKEKGFIIRQLETNEDHVHLFVTAPPHVSISTLVKWIKGISARLLLQRYVTLQKRLYRGHLWNPSYYVGTVGDMSEDIVRKYIESQKSEAPHKAKA